MKKIVIAGFARARYIESLKNDNRFKDYEIVCVHNRLLEEKHKKSVMLFDRVISEPEFSSQTNDFYSQIEAVSCTQERDIILYIDILYMLRFIDRDTYNLYLQLVNKKSFKEVLQKHNPQLVPKTWTRDQISEVVYPVVAKPSGLSGSSFVQKIHNQSELLHYIDHVEHEIHVKSVASYNAKEIEIFFESFEVGPQFSVNMYVDKNSNITFCPILRVIPAGQIGIDDYYSVFQYTTDELSKEHVQLLEDNIRTIVDTFCIKNSSAHFDFVLTDSGFKFFEAGIRIGGLRQEVFEVGYGFNHFINDIDNRLGKKISLPEKKQEVCIVQKASSIKGVLQDYSIPDTSEFDVVHKVPQRGVEVKPVKDGGATLVRYISSGQENLQERCSDLFKKISLDVRPLE